MLMTMPCYKNDKSMVTAACYKSDNDVKSNSNKDKVYLLLKR